MKLDFINKRNDILTLSRNDYFDLTNIDGMTTGQTNISSLTLGGVDGDTVNNIDAQPRTIIFDLKIKDSVNVETAKRAITKVIKLKQNGTLRWEQNERIFTISGIVETLDMPRWGAGVTMQISLHCEQPFWEDIEPIVQQINDALGLHYFTDVEGGMLYFPDEGIPLGEYDYSRTRQIHNAGDVSIGLEIEILAYGTVTNPIIYDTDGNYFGIGHGVGSKQLVLDEGDIIRINTKRGKKSVTLNGTTNLFAKIKPYSKWLQLEAGDNTFSIDSDDDSTDNMTFSLLYKQRYI